MQLTIDELREVNIKLSLRQNVLDACNTLSRQFSINTFLRIAHFMAQVCHESNGFRITVENLNLHNPPPADADLVREISCDRYSLSLNFGKASDL